MENTREALNKRLNRFHNLIGRAVERGDDAAVACYKRDLREVRAELEQLGEQPSIDMTEAEMVERLEEIRNTVIDATIDNMTNVSINNISDECKNAMSRYWKTEKTLRDKGLGINQLNTKVAGELDAYSRVLAVYGILLSFDIDWFDVECRFHRVTARRKDDNSVVFCVQNFGKDEWWA